MVERQAERGDEEASRILVMYPAPDALDYLLRWYTDLAWGIGRDQYGRLPLTWLAIQGWAELTGQEIRPHEARALMMLDTATRSPTEPDEDDA